MSVRFDDPLGLVSSDRSPRVTIGDVDITNALRGGTVQLAMDNPGEVQLKLDPAALPPDPIDYLATMTYSSQGTGVRGEFAGHVNRAVAEGGCIRLSAFGASLLTEHATGLLVSRGVAPPQLFYAMARTAGMADHELVISELDDGPPEVFEVIAPLHGVAIDGRLRMAGLTLLPAGDLEPRLDDMDFGEALDEMAADVYALSLQTARRVYTAEQDALRAIDTGIDWLATRLQHGLALFADGAIQDFARANARARPRRGEVVVVRGLLTGQRWLRSITRDAIGFSAAIAADDPLLDIEPSALRTTDRLALAACRRATTEGEPLARVQALSEAIECLVAKGPKPPRRWERADLRKIKEAVPRDLPPALHDAAKQAIGNLNKRGLMQRFEALLEDEGLPISDAELKILDRMRDVRNHTVHGRATTAPSPADLNYATAIVCRVVVEYLKRRQG